MKILAIHASPRGDKSRTLQLLRAVIKGARDHGADVDEVDLCKLKINYCIGCGGCYATGRCFHKDDFAALYARILASDGLIFASPNYFRSVTAQMKTMFDRMADTIHCQLLAGKYGVSVATAGGPASHEVNDYLNGLFQAFGASTVGAVGASPAIPGAMEAAEKDAVTLGKALVDAIRTQHVYPEQQAVHQQMREYFKQLVAMNKRIWQHEFEYWQKLGEL
ncbi:MAG: iron-sulfur protein [Lentisphaerae bacterium RIFOXYB12_FULL_65_16]|nr:MAG: iron-sulfur protein [Lentisphaerae bacterium RIFOXYA12_64_32]OGV85524.1 MAG: iron-sulfur protein [Lentisphaerae bacterium RIFOXYB12_FULL_65_16]